MNTVSSNVEWKNKDSSVTFGVSQHLAPHKKIEGKSSLDHYIVKTTVKFNE